MCKANVRFPSRINEPSIKSYGLRAYISVNSCEPNYTNENKHNRYNLPITSFVIGKLSSVVGGSTGVRGCFMYDNNALSPPVDRNKSVLIS